MGRSPCIPFSSSPFSPFFSPPAAVKWCDQKVFGRCPTIDKLLFKASWTICQHISIIPQELEEVLKLILKNTAHSITNENEDVGGGLAGLWVDAKSIWKNRLEKNLDGHSWSIDESSSEAQKERAAYKAKIRMLGEYKQ